MADTDTARALEVLRARSAPGIVHLTQAKYDALVALFAAAVELEAAEAAYREAALGVQPPFGTQEYTEAVVAAKARKKTAIAAHKAAIAAVTKGVLGHE